MDLGWKFWPENIFSTLRPCNPALYFTDGGGLVWDGDGSRYEVEAGLGMRWRPRDNGPDFSDQLLSPHFQRALYPSTCNGHSILKAKGSPYFKSWDDTHKSSILICSKLIALLFLLSNCINRHLLRQFWFQESFSDSLDQQNGSSQTDLPLLSLAIFIPYGGWG